MHNWSPGSTYQLLLAGHPESPRDDKNLAIGALRRKLGKHRGQNRDAGVKAAAARRGSQSRDLTVDSKSPVRPTAAVLKYL